MSGNYDPNTNNFNLVFNLSELSGPETGTSPQGSEVIAEMQLNPSSLQIQAPNWGQSFSTGPFTPWAAPPVAKQSGGSCTQTQTYGDLTVTNVVTVYPAISINRQGRPDASFLSTDDISLAVDLNATGYDPNTACWVVQSKSTNSGNGSPSTANNTSNFSFTPNPTDRPVDGSKTPNDPIMYQVQVTVGNLTSTANLQQDQIDTLRQEYVDYQVTVMDRTAFVAYPIDNLLNWGNHGYMLDNNMEGVANAITTAFNSLGQGNIQISSGFRSPQHNKQVGSTHPNSFHCYGRALDIQPNPFTRPPTPTMIAVMVSIAYATVNAGYNAYCESGPSVHVLCNSPLCDHVHVQWATP